jgi:transposase
MPMERMSIRHVRECLRLKGAGISTREIARRVGVASSTVRLPLRRCEAAGIACPLDAGLTEAMLEQRLFANAGVKPGHRRHAEPDWADVHRETRRKHVTLSILWNISPPILAVIGTPGFASCIGNGKGDCRLRP